MPDGLITPGLVWQVWEAGQDYQVTPTEFSDIMSTISSIATGAFVFGALGMVMGRLTKGVQGAVRE